MLLFFVAGEVSFAQTVGVKTDRNQLLIGERVQYDLLIDLPSPGYAINFKFPDSIPHFEILENENFDTSNSNGKFLVHKKIIFTSFDSGSWYIPSFEVLIERTNFSRRFITDSLPVDVLYSPADSTGALRDIKPVMEVTVTDYTWYYVAFAVLLGLLVAWIFYLYYKNRQQKPGSLFNAAFTPYDEAMKALQELQNADLLIPEQVKQYHSKLSDIFKRYYSRKLERNMTNKTTGEILVYLKEHAEDSHLVSIVAGALRVADAVKFAKFIPGVEASMASHGEVKQAVEIIEKKQSPPKQ